MLTNIPKHVGHSFYGIISRNINNYRLLGDKMFSDKEFIVYVNICLHYLPTKGYSMVQPSDLASYCGLDAIEVRSVVERLAILELVKTIEVEIEGEQKKRLKPLAPLSKSEFFVRYPHTKGRVVLTNSWE